MTNQPQTRGHKNKINQKEKKLNQKKTITQLIYTSASPPSLMINYQSVFISHGHFEN